MSDRWLLGGIAVDLATQRVARGDASVRLSPRAAAVLRALIACGNRPLLREEALDQVWSQSATGDEVVSKAINELRQALGDTDARARRFIETIPKRGYRLLCAIVAADEATAAPAAETADAAASAASTALPVVAIAAIPSAGSVDQAAAHPPSPPSASAARTAAASPPSATPVPTRDPATPAPPADAPAGTADDPELPAAAAPLRKAAIAAPRSIAAPGPAQPRLIWVALGLALAAAGIATLLQKPGTAFARYSAESLRRDLAAGAQPVVAATDYVGYVAALPDGSGAVYSALQQGHLRLQRRAFAATAASPLTQADGSDELAPALSHDGRWIAFAEFRGSHCQLQLRSLSDGSQRDLAPCSLRFAEWLEFTPDNSALLLPRLRAGETQMSLHRLNLADGAIAPLDYPREPRGDDMQARYSPDGRWLALRRGAQPHSALWLIDLRRNRARELLSSHWGLDGFAWLPDSNALIAASSFGSDAGLWRISVDARRDFLGQRGANCPSIAPADGSLLYTQGPRRFGIHRLVLDNSADAELPQPFAATRGNDWFPRWSADGSTLAFLSDSGGATALRLVANGVPESIAPPPQHTPAGMPSFSSDGNDVLLPTRDAQGHGVLQAYDRRDARWYRIGERNDVEEAVASSDGRWIYLLVNQGERRSLWRRSRESGSEQQLADQLARSPLAVDSRGGVYFIDAPRQVLLRRDADGSTQRVLEDMGYWNAYGWTVAGDAVYAVLEPGGQNFGLYRARVGQAPELAEPLDGTATLGLALNTERGELLVSRPPRAGLSVHRTLLSSPTP